MPEQQTPLWKKAVAALLLAFIVGYAAGRYAKPDKVIVQKEVVQQENKQTDTQTKTDRDRHRTTVTVEVTKPDGTKEIRTKTTDDSNTKRVTDTDQKDVTLTKTQEKTETINRSNDVSLNFLAGPNVPAIIHGEPLNMCYGGQISKRILGPFSVGAWGLSCGQGGLSVGIQF